MLQARGENIQVVVCDWLIYLVLNKNFFLNPITKVCILACWHISAMEDQWKWSDDLCNA